MYLLLKKNCLIFSLIVLFSVNGNAQISESNFPNLPFWMSVLSDNGSNPSWKKNSHEVCFIDQWSKNSVAIDIKTGNKSQITWHFSHSGFAYCLNLSNGDYLLCGNSSEKTGDPKIDEHRQEMWVMNKNLKRTPISLNEFCDRSPALSRNGTKIAWTATGQQEIFVAEIVYHEGKPVLENKKMLLSYKDSSSVIHVETQDFRPSDDNELLFTRFTGTADEPFSYAEVCGYNLQTGVITNYSKSPESFDEARGVSPDGKYIFIESDRHFDRREWKTDIYKLTLDGSAQAERLTFFSSDNMGMIVENPVLSDDGKYMAFQVKTRMGILEPKCAVLLFDFELYKQAMQTVYPGKSWDERSPESQGIDSAKLQEALNYLEANCDVEYGIKSSVIICNGYIIHKGEYSKSLRSVFSVTKSFTSTVAGLLIDRGQLSIDNYARDFEPLLEKYYPNVTIRHFLTMTSGYAAVGESPWPNFKIDDCSPTPFDVDKPLFLPGTKYCYYDEAMMMFGRVLTQLCKTSLTEFLQANILTPIGIDSSWGWDEKRGLLNNILIDNGSCYINMSAEQLARFGYLFLNQGRWGNRQLISRDWVEQATKNQVDPSIPIMETKRMIDGRGEYGYNWWVNGITKSGKRSMPHAPAKTFYASGANNNQCFVVPEWNMVIVRLGDRSYDKEPSWDKFFELLSKSRISGQ